MDNNDDDNDDNDGVKKRATVRKKAELSKVCVLNLDL